MSHLEAERPHDSPSSEEERVAIFAGFTLLGMILLLLVLPYVDGLLGTNAAQPSTQPKSGAGLTSSSRVFIRGIGPIRIDMTVAEAVGAIGRPLLKSSEMASSGNCYYVEPEGGPAGIALMVIEERIVRIDITNPQIQSRAGVKIGSSERQVLSLYSGRIKVQAHQYDEHGHYLVFSPKDRNDRDYTIIFETDGKVVTTFRAGKLPAVAYVEHCL